MDMEKNMDQIMEQQIMEQLMHGDLMQELLGKFLLYGSFEDLGPVWEKYIQPSDAILQIGYANSTLAERLYDNGFPNIHIIDTDAQFIAKQTQKHFNERPGLKFEHRSPNNFGVPDASFNVVLERGTLDSFLPSSDETIDDAAAGSSSSSSCKVSNEVDLVISMFHEIGRCLKLFGRYISITLAEPQTVEMLFNFFGFSNKFLCQVYSVEQTFMRPFFIFVVTKMQMESTLTGERRPIEFLGTLSSVGDGTPPQLVYTFDELMDKINAACLRHMLSKGPASQRPILVRSTVDNSTRYELSIADDPSLNSDSLYSYGVLVVPVGRENYWLFTTQKGRSLLRARYSLDRLLVVRPFQDQEYGTLEDMKMELGKYVFDFKPKGCDGHSIIGISIGFEEIPEQIAFGSSEINGAWSVEQLEEAGGVVSRRLYFVDKANPLEQNYDSQSAVTVERIFKADGSSCWRTVWSNLVFVFHKMMLSSLQLLPSLASVGGLMSDGAVEVPLRIALLGLGGGVLAKFLHDKFKQSEIVAIEIDPEMLKIAREHFDFPSPDESDRLKVIICDALDFLREYSVLDSPKFDALFVDLYAGGSANDNARRFNCPPDKFVTEQTLTQMRNCLTEKGGVLSLNLAINEDHAASSSTPSFQICDDVGAGDAAVEQLSFGVKKMLSSIFPCVYSIKSSGNEVLNCCTCAPFIENLMLPNISELKLTAEAMATDDDENGGEKLAKDDGTLWMKECAKYLAEMKAFVA